MSYNNTMKIALAQIQPIKADVASNILHHLKYIRLAAENDADIIIFPELSITGYEPGLAKELAVDMNDNIFQDFQQISDAKNIIIGIGMPLKSNAGITISMVIFQPNKGLTVYHKHYLHADEEPYFVSGVNTTPMLPGTNNIALAICYELSVPDHAQYAYVNGANIYLASVAKTSAGMEKAYASLSEIAAKYEMITLICNAVGHCDNFYSAGGTAFWNKQGTVMASLNDSDEALLIADTATGKAIILTIQ